MHKKSFTFGIGTGILAMTLVFYFVYNTQLSKYNEGFQKALAEQKTQIESGVSVPEPVVNDILIQPSDAKIIERAKQLGMTFPEGVLDACKIPPVTPIEPTEPTEPAETPKPANTQKPQASVITDEESYAVIEIAEGNVSSEIAAILFQAGVIDNAASFDDFLAETGNTKKLAFGKFTISKNLSYEEVLAVIKVK